MTIIRPTFIEINCETGEGEEKEKMCLSVAAIRFFYPRDQHSCGISVGSGNTALVALHSYEEIKEMINPALIPVIMP